MFTKYVDDSSFTPRNEESARILAAKIRNTEVKEKKERAER
jgi:hypothetical protein